MSIRMETNNIEKVQDVVSVEVKLNLVKSKIISV